MLENGELEYHGYWATDLNEVKTEVPKNQTSTAQALISKAIYTSKSMIEHHATAPSLDTSEDLLNSVLPAPAMFS